MCQKSTGDTKLYFCKTVGFLSWTFNVPGLWSLHCSVVNLGAAKPLSAGAVSDPEHCSITTDLTGTAEFGAVLLKFT